MRERTSADTVVTKIWSCLGPPLEVLLNGPNYIWPGSSDGTLIARFVGPTWGPSGADRTQVGPMLDPWTLLSGAVASKMGTITWSIIVKSRKLVQNEGWFSSIFHKIYCDSKCLTCGSDFVSRYLSLTTNHTLLWNPYQLPCDLVIDLSQAGLPQEHFALTLQCYIHFRNDGNGEMSVKILQHSVGQMKIPYHNVILDTSICHQYCHFAEILVCFVALKEWIFSQWRPRCTIELTRHN